MDITEIKETPIWALYEKGRNYHRRVGIYVDTDKNYNFYNGNQWAGAKLGEVEPVQINFIKPIVKYKCAVIHANLYAINYSSQNHESEAFQQEVAEAFRFFGGVDDIHMIHAHGTADSFDINLLCRRSV